MAGGQLKCSGTSFFLKKRFGTGYHLICVKDETCITHNVTELLAKYIPDIEVESDIGTELSYQLPENKVSIFEQMFSDLEDHRVELHLEGYGVSLTTLEEVFLKIGSDSFSLDGTTSNSISNGITANGNGYSGFDSEKSINASSTASTISDTAPLLHGLRLKQNQWYAMLKKKLIYWSRNWVMYFLQNLIPITFVVISVLVVRSMEKLNSLPPLEITLRTYEKTVTVLEKSLNTIPSNLTARQAHLFLVTNFSCEYLFPVFPLFVQNYFGIRNRPIHRVTQCRYRYDNTGFANIFP